MAKNGTRQKRNLASDISRIAKLADIDLDRVGDLVRRAQNGDGLAMDELSQVLEKLPDLIRELGGELSYEIEREMAAAIAGDDIIQQAAIRASMSVQRSTFVEHDTPPLERALVAEVALCRLHYQVALIESSRNQEESTSHRKFLQGQVDRTQRQYVAAIRMLIIANEKLARSSPKFNYSGFKMPR